MATKFNFDRVKNNFARLKKELPVVLANQAQNFFTKSFTQQGFDNDGVQAWAEVERRKPDTKAYKWPRKHDMAGRTRGILFGAGSGKLRRAVQNSIRETTWNRTRLVIDLPYAKIHNEGGQGRAFGKHPFKMKRRRFMGKSRHLNRLHVTKIKTTVDRIWKA